MICDTCGKPATHVVTVCVDTVRAFGDPEPMEVRKRVNACATHKRVGSSFRGISKIREDK